MAIERQNEDLSKLKAAKEKVESLKQEMHEAEDRETYHTIKKKLEDAEELYKDIRYSEKRIMSDVLTLWRDRFVASIREKRMKDPNRLSLIHI